MPLLMAACAVALRRRCLTSLQQCYLHCLHILISKEDEFYTYVIVKCVLICIHPAVVLRCIVVTAI